VEGRTAAAAAGTAAAEGATILPKARVFQCPGNFLEGHTGRKGRKLQGGVLENGIWD
jgi:hypothetical protein